MNADLLYKIYKIKSNTVRKIVLRYVERIEGGAFYSKTLRKIYLDYYNIEIGMYSYGGCFSFENIPPGTRIGRYCSFAKNVYFLAGNHPAKFKSLHPFFYNPDFGYVPERLVERAMYIIENDVWIGQGAIIVPTVRIIENGAIIGAGSVVTKNVPPYAIVAGNPAEIKGYRFSDAVIKQLLDSKWWNKDINEIRNDQSEFKQFNHPLE